MSDNLTCDKRTHCRCDAVCYQIAELACLHELVIEVVHEYRCDCDGCSRRNTRENLRQVPSNCTEIGDEGFRHLPQKKLRSNRTRHREDFFKMRVNPIENRLELFHQGINTRRHKAVKEVIGG